MIHQQSLRNAAEQPSVLVKEKGLDPTCISSFSLADTIQLAHPASAQTSGFAGQHTDMTTWHQPQLFEKSCKNSFTE